MRAVVLIPARFKSTRYPGKPLVPLLGKPMVLWVAELCARAVGVENVYVATEDQRIADVVTDAGFNAVITTDTCLTGTDRLAEAALQVKADIYVNVQGDEPLVNPIDIIKAIDTKRANMSAVVNGYSWISASENPISVNIPKVITTENNKLIYMSRQALPGFKDKKCAPARYKKQVCIYAFTADELAMFASFGRKSELEFSEDIEILRFLELDKTVEMYETQPGSLAVDIPEDVAPAEAALRRLHDL
ncbi:3-deoxy-manno-octulosonate cytidylyltransferase [Cellvibrio polysaccharolyticus]|uniref:3-deoxy-manno-octulosonate cytidylyltransferase n=1 Tax=Cellvibrio polysaccharolyticus TaxID=2082724 RepID=A0A928V739_9GAMM|nr:3-deoxy-manno-octulosonate cytidylyltransferase [Cellvibrio polysaccharolyticus]MBE8718355.1 3-deoxy-manno-octulosonate cytidylyltransferase [Cellvibrio polysaccharolyticus]